MSDPPKPKKRPSPARRSPGETPEPAAGRGGVENGKTPPARKGAPTKKPARPTKHPGSKPPKKAGRPRSGKRKPAPRAPISLRKRLGLGAAVALAVAVLGFVAFVILPGPGDGKPVELEWQPTDNPGEAADRLAAAGLVRSAFLMSLYLRVADWKHIDPGHHLLQNDMSPRTLIRRLRRLRGGTQVDVVIPEGFNKFDIAQRLHDAGVCSTRGFRVAASNEALMQELRVPAPHAEGYLFPATYPFARNEAPNSVVSRLVNETTKRHARIFGDAPEAVAKLEKDLGWSRHSIVVLASMIEKEAAVDEERALIASVFLNRMYSESFRPRQRLQSDPTARYGCLLQPDATPTCAGADKGVTGPMVRDPLNPYSTYAHSGLPPGPICNPSESSLRAVLAPAQTEYLYFVAKGGGRHKFSVSYDEHRSAIPSNREP